MKATKLAMAPPAQLAGLALLGAVGFAAATSFTSYQAFQFPSELRTLDVTTNAGVTKEEIANGVQWAGGGSKVLMRIQEKNPMTQDWEKTVFTSSVAYAITSVATRSGGKFVFIAGAHSNGDAVVEKWVFPTVAGSYKVTVQPAETRIGVARGPFTADVTIKGGTYIPHSSRYSQASGIGSGLSFSAQPVPQKTELYRGSAYGLFDSIAVDPEGRFLLLHSYDTGVLHSVNIAGAPFTVQTLYAPATAPFRRNQHAPSGSLDSQSSLRSPQRE